MKKAMLSMLAIAFTATTVLAGETKPVKKVKAKQAACGSCAKDKCSKACEKPMSKAECKKAGC